jgi:hypothetical protein
MNAEAKKSERRNKKWKDYIFTVSEKKVKVLKFSLRKGLMERKRFSSSLIRG